MPILRTLISLSTAALLLLQGLPAQAADTASASSAAGTSYILGDSIAYGLHLDGLEGKLQEKLGGRSQISFDGARSLTTPGNQIKKTAFESVDADKNLIATAKVIVIILGMNQLEKSFVDSQAKLMKKLKTIAPDARYFWVDIGATIATQAADWSWRNKVIYDNAKVLGYQVISRYKAIFGECADPLNIKPGQVFPDWESEPGYNGTGNVHGYYPELSKAIVDAVTNAPKPPPMVCPVLASTNQVSASTYVLGDSISYGLYKDRLSIKLQNKLGGPSKISYDGGRSITTPGSQIKKTALESVEIDKAYIAAANIIVVILGTNQMEESFAKSQVELMQALKAIAPKAKYYWVDIGATIAPMATGWSARNKIIYDNAQTLGYTVISRYKAIFGPDADPLNITPGLNFPGWMTEPGFGGPGNIHGMYAELTKMIVDTLSVSNQVSPPK
jgi:putative Mn2+ efflux pump MntP